METHQRKSHTSINRIYFWTATIHKWLPLLENDFNKQLKENGTSKYYEVNEANKKHKI
jgi:hypothetical protein